VGRRNGERRLREGHDDARMPGSNSGTAFVKINPEGARERGSGERLRDTSCGHVKELAIGCQALPPYIFERIRWLWDRGQPVTKYVHCLHANVTVAYRDRRTNPSHFKSAPIRNAIV
jgi:hypothetical protein